jgi:chemotaxis protein methyltransferase CheR
MVSTPDEYQLSKLLAKIHRERSLDFSGFRLAYVGRRVSSRLVATGSETLRDYVRLIDQDEIEYAELLNALTVNVSEFFRDRSVFDYIARHVIPELIELKKSRPREMLRVWSAGCSTGEEPYSLAMLIKSELQGRGNPYDFTISGTDIDPHVVSFAKRGRYPIDKLEQIPLELRQKYVKVDGDSFVISDALKAVVKFRRLDLFADNSGGAIDLILCRNVMIYVDRKNQRAVLGKFVDSLRKGGFLVIGKSEKLPQEVSERLVARELREHVYQYL